MTYYHRDNERLRKIQMKTNELTKSEANNDLERKGQGAENFARVREDLAEVKQELHKLHSAHDSLVEATSKSPDNQQDVVAKHEEWRLDADKRHNAVSAKATQM